MTNEEYIKMIQQLHTETAAQKQVVPLWQDFIQCRITAGDYNIRLRTLEETIMRCRKEDKARASQARKLEQELQRRGAR